MTALTRTQRAIIIVLVLMVIFSFVAIINMDTRIRGLEEAMSVVTNYIGRGR